MKSFSYYCTRFVAALIGGVIVFAGAAAAAHADTDVTNGYIFGDAVWDVSGSPYHIHDPITIPSGISLTIGPGVSVIGTEDIDGYPLIDVEGELSVRGASDDRVSLSGFGGISISRRATTSIEYADVSIHDGISAFNSFLGIVSSTITGASQGIHLRSSSVSVRASQIKANGTGIFVESSGPSMPPQSLEGGDLSASSPAGVVSHVSVADSDMTENSGAAIENQDSVAVEAVNDWWGSDDGPALSGNNRIVGLVEYEPWQKRASKAVCCSSVLFIPGLEATRIYSPTRGPLGLGGTTTIRGWEPLSNADAQSIYLNPDGSSINPNAYSGAPLDRAYGIADIYGSFMKFLDGLVAGGTIGRWKSFGYDWRKPIPQVVDGLEKKATSTESLMETVAAMASSSKTGKVTLIAHSNGGLVAKYLVKKLADLGKAGLIDKVISVAVPYLGTPQAIASLLYGDGTSIGYGVLLKQSVAQKLAENMSSAYSLLPSAEYFKRAMSPTIAYASGAGRPVLSASVQDSIVSSKANKGLMAAAESLHAILDPFEWPTAITRWALVGWGNQTVKSLIYAKNGTDKHTASTTLFGDGTVVTASASYDAGTTTALDLPMLSRSESRTIDHTDILGASSTQAVIRSIIEGTDSLAGIPGVSIGLPSDSNALSHIVVSTHSPVDLHVYDSHGNHTGIIPAPLGSGVTDDVVSFFETKIPGSTFSRNGGDGSADDTDTEIDLPADSGQKYSVAIQGNGVGEFTYEVQFFKGDALASDVIYSGLPTTPLTVASSTVLTGIISSTTPLSIDVDGDGATDMIAKPRTTLDPDNFFECLRKSLSVLLGPKAKRFSDLSGRIDRIETAFRKDKNRKVLNKLGKLEAALGHRRFKSLTQTDRDRIADMADSFIGSLGN